jgi:hypothetical protein
MKTLKRFTKFIVTISFLLASVTVSASIPYRNANEAMDLINSQTRELNMDLFAKIQIIMDQNSFHMGDYIPYSQLTQNDPNVANKILKQTLNSIFRAENIANSKLVQQAQNLNNSLATSMQSNGHSVSFRFKALETRTEVIYSGAVNAAVSYQFDGRQSQLAVSKEILGKTISYTLSSNNEGTRNMVGMNWSF